MIRYENQCCDCAVPGYPCLGSSCPYVDVPVYYCDACDNEIHTGYEIDGDHYCEGCARQYINECFKDLTLSEQAEALDITLKSLED